MTHQPPVEIGHVIINCRRCQQPRHLPVVAATRPTATNDTLLIRTLLDNEQVGQIHLYLRALPGDHTCGTPHRHTLLRAV